MTVNVVMSYGVGDASFGQWLLQLQNKAKAAFGADVYSPRILDWTEQATMNRLVGQFKDPTILVAHSCGNKTITAAALANSMKRIPFVLVIAPSIFCPVVPFVSNVVKATQASSWVGDWFNPGARQLISNSPSNHVTKLDCFTTGLGHVQAPGSPAVEARLFEQISLVLKGQKT